jgi:hypothetical protein
MCPAVENKIVRPRLGVAEHPIDGLAGPCEIDELGRPFRIMTAGTRHQPAHLLSSDRLVVFQRLRKSRRNSRARRSFASMQSDGHASGGVENGSLCLTWDMAARRAALSSNPQGLARPLCSCTTMNSLQTAARSQAASRDGPTSPPCTIGTRDEPKNSSNKSTKRTNPAKGARQQAGIQDC